MSVSALGRPRVGVGVLVRRAGEVLLLRRQHVHGAGSWSTPGGHLEGGELPEQCAAREVMEETGVEIRDVRYFGMTNDVFALEQRHYITLWMEAEYQAGTAAVLAPHEMSEVRWFPAEALPENLFLSLRHLVDGEGYSVDWSRGRLRVTDASPAE